MLLALIDDPFGYSRDPRAVFTPGQVAEVLGVTRRKVLLWNEQDIVQPSVPSDGRGHSRRFSLRDLGALGVARELDHVGIVPRFIQLCIRAYLAESKRYDFRGKELGTGTQERPAPVEFSAPNIVVFSYTSDRAARGECHARFHEVGPGFPEEAFGVEQLMKNPASLIVNLRNLRHDVEQGLRRLFYIAPFADGE